MWRWMAAALLLSAFAPGVQAESVPVDKALSAAMKSFYVIVPADVATGKSVTELRGNADGTGKRAVVVAFLDAADAAAEMSSAGLSKGAEGRLVNGAELIAMSGGDVVWRTSKPNAEIVNTVQTTPPVFYITNAEGKSLTQKIDGQEKVLFYLDAVAADAARVAIQNGLSASGEPSDLSLVAADFNGLVAGVQTGDVKNARFVSAPSVIRWASQWDNGARLIKDYKGAGD